MNNKEDGSRWCCQELSILFQIWTKPNTRSRANTTGGVVIAAALITYHSSLIPVQRRVNIHQNHPLQQQQPLPSSQPSPFPCLLSSGPFYFSSHMSNYVTQMNIALLLSPLRAMLPQCSSTQPRSHHQQHHDSGPSDHSCCSPDRLTHRPTAVTGGINRPTRLHAQQDRRESGTRV